MRYDIYPIHRHANGNPTHLPKKCRKNQRVWKTFRQFIIPKNKISEWKSYEKKKIETNSTKTRTIAINRCLRTQLPYNSEYTIKWHVIETCLGTNYLIPCHTTTLIRGAIRFLRIPKPHEVKAWKKPRDEIQYEHKLWYEVCFAYTLFESVYESLERIRSWKRVNALCPWTKCTKW